MTAESTQIKPSIVFAHGLWADGSCFSKLIPTLQAEGHEVVSVQNSLDSLQGDVDAVIRALGRVSGGGHRTHEDRSARPLGLKPSCPNDSSSLSREVRRGVRAKRLSQD